ncbi:MAG: crotonobetainyl-CoA:carnitine CoA-transferase CaiB-like acyl-CoA transferase [Candidatus Azotimanducaceae bacterium]
MALPLDGITIIEIDNWMAAPSAAAILSDMGATVIKIEPLTGDPMRGNFRPAKVDGLRDYDFQFDVDNRGKRSVCVDLTNPAAIDILHKLCGQAQIFMCNLLTQRQEKFRLDPETLLAINPSLVHATLTGYGTTGPDAERPGYDVTAFFGRSGLYDSMREGPHGDVPMARPAQGDHTTGLALVGAILGALRLAERTGTGQVVETSLYETAVWTQASDYATTAVDHAPVRQRSRENMLLPTANRYPCGDDKWVVFNMPQASGWAKLCKALNKEEWLEDERFLDARSRYHAMPVLVPEIDKALASKTRDEWGVIFDAAGIIWGPVLGLHEVATDPQAAAINLFPSINDEEIGDYRTVSIPMRFKTADVRPRGRSPKIGEHTRSVLSEFGFDAAVIDGLLADDVIR